MVGKRHTRAGIHHVYFYWTEDDELLAAVRKYSGPLPLPHTDITISTGTEHVHQIIGADGVMLGDRDDCVDEIMDELAELPSGRDLANHAQTLQEKIVETTESKPPLEVTYHQDKLEEIRTYFASLPSEERRTSKQVAEDLDMHIKTAENRCRELYKLGSYLRRHGSRGSIKYSLSRRLITCTP